MADDAFSRAGRFFILIFSQNMVTIRTGVLIVTNIRTVRRRI